MKEENRIVTGLPMIQFMVYAEDAAVTVKIKRRTRMNAEGNLGGH